MQFEQYSAGFPDGQITVKYHYRGESSKWHFILHQPLESMTANEHNTVRLTFENHLLADFQVCKFRF